MSIAPTITNFSVPAKTTADGPFTITAPTSDSTGAFTYTSSKMTTTGNLYVAVGQTGNSIATSPNGITWTGRTGTTIFSGNGRGVAYGNGLWVAVGDGTGNTMATSTDGINWTGRGKTVFATSGWGVAYANNLWVAVGYGGNAIATSTDGITWTGRTGLTVFTVYGQGIAYGNGLWVAVGYGANTIATSVNGINWTGRGATIFSSGYNAVYKNNLWVAVGEGTNTIASSTDGINWTGRGKTVLTNYGGSVDYGNGLWVAAGYSGATGNTIATSVNGITWIGRGISTNGGYSVVYANNLWVTVGYNNGTGNNTIATSVDGITWTGRGATTFTFCGFCVTSNYIQTPTVDTTVASITGNTITIIGVGSSTITATQASTTNYKSGTITAGFVVTLPPTLPPTITNFTISAKTFGNAPFTITDPSSNSTGAFTYTSSNTAVATVSGKLVTIIGGGSSTITATQAGTADYLSGTITTSFVVNPVAPVLTSFSVSTKVFGDASFNITPPTSNSAGAFTYTSSNTAVATISGNVVTIVGGGSSTITASQASTTNYTTGTITTSLVVSPTTTVLTNFSVPAKTFLDASFGITAPTSNSNGAFTYTSSNTSVATVSGNVLTIVGAGSSTITANQASTASYISATITASLVVSKATPTITFSIPTKVIGVAPFIPDPITNSTGAFTYTSSDLTVATVTGNTITILKIGTSTITAVQASDSNYISSGTITTTLLVTLPTPTIIFSIPEKLVGIAPFTITPPTSNSAGAFTYTSSQLSVATVLGNKITIVGAGSSIITANQAGTATYLPGISTTTLIVDLPTPTITKFTIPAKTFGNIPFAIVKPTSNNSSNFTYTSNNSSVATISGGMVTIVGGGSSTITASQPETIKFKAGSITTSLVVSPIKPIITSFSIPIKIVGNAPFTITDPSSNSTGAFTYTSATPSVVTIDGSMVTIVGNGSSVITAVQASTANYISGTITAPLVVRLPAPTLTNFSVSTKVFGDASFNITPPTSNSIGTFTYTSSALTVAKITGNMITIVGVGTAIISAIQAGSANYVSGTITASFVVTPATPTIINFSIPQKIVGIAPFAITAPKSNSKSVFTYTNSNLSVLTISGNKITVVGPGSSTITASQISTPNYTAGSITATFVAILPTPKIAKLAIPAKIFGTAPFSIIDPSSNSTGAFSYTSSNLSVVTISGNVVTIVGRGSSIITAVQAGTDNYVSGTIAAILIINPATPTITNFSIPAKIFGNAPFTITDPSSNSTGTFTYTSAKLTVATVAGNEVTIVGIGSSVITATQAIGANHISGKITATFISNPPAPTIANLTIPAKTFGNAPFALTAPTSNSAGAFTYTSSNTSVATLSKNIVTIVGIGNSTITANQVGTAIYASGTITGSLVVSQGTPTITNFTIPVKIIGNAPFSITPPTSNSTGAFTYTSSNTAVATVEGNVITIVGNGSSTITAEQASTTNYISGTITATLVVNLLTPTITGFTVPAKTFGNAPFTITDPSSNSTGAFTYTSSNLSVLTISGNVVTIVGGGTSIISAVQASTDSYASRTITVTLKVNPGTPTITNFSIPNKTVGTAPFSITAPTSNSAGNFTYISSKLTVATISGNIVTIVGAGTSTITANQLPTSNYITGKITTTLVVSP